MLAPYPITLKDARKLAARIAIPANGLRFWQPPFDAFVQDQLRCGACRSFLEYVMTDSLLTMTIEEDYVEIRDQVRKLCADFPDSYWLALEREPPESSYPTDFINALTEAGYLAALIPEEYGGAGLDTRGGAVILETINEMGCSAAAGHAQMYTMGTVLRHGSEEQKSHFLPQIARGELRLQAFGVTEPTTGSDTTQLKTRATKNGSGYIINGQKVWTSRAAHSDLMLLLARTTPADQVKRRTDGISTFLIDLQEAQKMGCEIRPIDISALDLFMVLRSATYLGWIISRMDEPGAAERNARYIGRTRNLAEDYLQLRASQ